MKRTSWVSETFFVQLPRTMQLWPCMCTLTEMSSYWHVAAGACVAPTLIISLSKDTSSLPDAAPPFWELSCLLTKAMECRWSECATNLHPKRCWLTMYIDLLICPIKLSIQPFSALSMQSKFKHTWTSNLWMHCSAKLAAQPLPVGMAS